MKKYRIELTMACLLLVCFYLLSRQAAVISVNQAEQGTQKAVGPLILVDAGHGGSDPGMIGMGGLEEKGINLSISLFLRDRLEKSGYSVMITGVIPYFFAKLIIRLNANVINIVKVIVRLI